MKDVLTESAAEPILKTQLQAKLQADPAMSFGDMMRVILATCLVDLTRHPQVVYNHTSVTGVSLEIELSSESYPIRIDVPESWITNPQY